MGYIFRTYGITKNNNNLMYILLPKTIENSFIFDCIKQFYIFNRIGNE